VLFLPAAAFAYTSVSDSIRQGIRMTRVRSQEFAPVVYRTRRFDALQLDSTDAGRRQGPVSPIRGALGE
jgi:hypothetical protein